MRSARSRARQVQPHPGAGVPEEEGGIQVRYRDQAGNAWSGRGPKPRWLKEALAAGHSPESLAA